MILAGAARETIACENDGTHLQPALEAKALALESNGVRIAILACDLCGIRSDLADMVRTKASRSTGIPFENIAIACSHTHGDGLRSIYAQGLGKTFCAPGEGWTSWLDELDGKLVRCIEKAAASLEEVSVSSATGHIAGISTPARIKLKEGGVHCLKIQSPMPWRNEIAGQLPVDNSLLTVRLTGSNGKILAHIVNFSCHANTSISPDEKPKPSGDFPAYAMRHIESRLGGIALFLNGACADIYPVDYMTERGEAQVKRLGSRLADAVIAMSEELKTDGRQCVETRHSNVMIPLRERDLHAERKSFEAEWKKSLDKFALKGVALNFEQFMKLYPKYLSGDREHAKKIEEYLVLIQTMEKTCSKRVDVNTAKADLEGVFSCVMPKGSDSKRINAELQAIAIGDTAFAFLPGEIFNATGLQIKAGSQFKTTGVVTLTNAAIDYIPSAEGFDEGGYQVQVSQTDRSAANVLCNATCALLTDIHKHV